ncbi:MAG: butyrate kinase, partial [Oscillospiraceae bacterium]|nr:butyrate kinase [Oscillospiraceae bacterium]
MSEYKILTINPGSTSTKIAIYEGTEKLFSANVAHDASELAKYPGISEQLPYREKTIRDLLAESGVSLDGVAAVVGRGGGLMAMEGGVYGMNDIMLDHATRGANGVQHPAQLGPQLAKKFSEEIGCPAFVVNPPDVDEMQPIARMTGVKGMYRTMHLHSLNLKETAIQHSKSIGKKYEDCNYIVCHIGGGISVSAHQKGRMIDGNGIVDGEGPMAPTRCGALPVAEVINYCFSEGMDKKTAKALCTKSGGFVSLMGTSDAIEVSDRAAKGEKVPYLAWNAMIYQITKYIGAMAAALHGEV